jgi:hypothetical protein
VVFQRADRIVLGEGSVDVATLPLSPLVPPEAVLAAIAAGWALGLTPDLIGAGLRTFEATPKKHITERTHKIYGSHPHPRPSRPESLEPPHCGGSHRFVPAGRTFDCRLAGFEQRLHARFPAIGALQPTGHSGDVPMARVWRP